MQQFTELFLRRNSRCNDATLSIAVDNYASPPAKSNMLWVVVLYFRAHVTRMEVPVCLRWYPPFDFSVIWKIIIIINIWPYLNELMLLRKACSQVHNYRLLQRTPLKRITDNRINRLVESYMAYIGLYGLIIPYSHVLKWRRLNESATK